MSLHKTSQSWLAEAVDHITELYGKTKEDGQPVQVPPVVVNVGFGPSLPRKARGWCFPSKAAQDGVHQIYITPMLGPDDSEQILAILIHEIAHAIDDCEHGHTGRFRKLVEQMGLMAPVTTATAGEPLKEILKPILQTLGTYPHSLLDLAETKVKKQTTRMIKVECKQEVELDEPGKVETCGYTLRTTQTWLDVGIPYCPRCDERMEVEEKAPVGKDDPS